MKNNPAVPFHFHLKDLRNRLIKMIISLCIGFVACWFFASEITSLMTEPIANYLTATGGKLIFTNPIEKFMSYMKVSFFVSLLAVCPYWFFQVWKFVSPGLYNEEKKWTLIFVSFSSCLFVLGTAFVYFLILPMALKFLIQLGGGSELPYISLKDYISFFTRTCLMFGLVFQTPLVLSFLIKLKVVSVQKLRGLRPYVCVLVAALSAFITPPDILSMVFVMIPLYLFFEASLWIGSRI